MNGIATNKQFITFHSTASSAFLTVTASRLAMDVKSDDATSAKIGSTATFEFVIVISMHTQSVDTKVPNTDRAVHPGCLVICTEFLNECDKQIIYYVSQHSVFSFPGRYCIEVGNECEI